MKLNSDVGKPGLGEVVSAGGALASGLMDTVQRVVILVMDVLLICMALNAMWSDSRYARRASCEEPLNFYGGICIFLSLLDMVLELVRCTLESSLDRLQSDCQQAVSLGSLRNENLLSGEVGQVSCMADEAGAGARSGPSSASPWKRVGKEKDILRRRTGDLQWWSVFFTCFVSVFFSFLTAHDPDCEMNSPNLYNYIHNFTYVYILRLGVVILGMCCRTVKNYEDAAASSGALQASAASQMAVRRF